MLNQSNMPSPAYSQTESEQQLLQTLRNHRKTHRQHQSLPHHPSISQRATLGQRVADKVAATVGSWRFILAQSFLIVVWISWNMLNTNHPWDPYPFILLNLVLSFQAAYTAPAIMMSQNRQAEIDRLQANSDYEINVKAELEIELLHQKIDILREQEIRDLSAAVKALTEQLNTRHL